jgi:GST-like protein
MAHKPRIAAPMIDFYTWTTPNGRKVAIMLEEALLDYRAHPVDISKGQQFEPAFLKVSPNNKIPAIVDHDVPGGPVSVFESGAILVHLAEKAGRFLPAGAARATTLQWLFWQVGGFGPMLGQFYHFARRTDDGDAYARTRFSDEAERLYGVLDRRLAEAEFVAGDYSIADMAIYPWSAAMRRSVERATGESFAHVARWEEEVGRRPAVGRGMGVPAV